MAHDKRGPRVMRWATVSGLLLLALSARAQPLVRVQAGTQIVLHGARGDNGGFAVRGALLDDLGAPLPDRALEIRIAAAASGEPVRQATVHSADDGSFGVAAELAPAAYRVHVHFAGDSHHARSESVSELDLTRADVRLAFIEPRELRLDLDAAQHPIALRASSARGGAGLSVEVQNERGERVTLGTTDGQGMLIASAPASALGAPGHGKLIAVSASDALRDAARAEIPVLRWRATRLSLSTHDARNGHPVLEGMLRDSRSGVGGKAIGLFDNGTHLATVVAGRDGRFRYDGLRPREGGSAEGVLRLQARFDSDAPWLGSSRSEVVELSPAPGAPRSALWLLLPLCSSAVLVWLLLRRPAAERAAQQPAAAVGVGIHRARARARGRAEHRRIAGRVRDAASERPVRGVVIDLVGPGGARLTLAGGEDGAFRTDALDDGEWKLSIRAGGYATLAATLAIPHRGEWDELDVKLQSLRSAAVAAYRPAALRVLPNAELWLRWTPRETLASARQSGRATEAFVRLTQRVEQAAYAGPAPRPEDVAEIERTASEALARFPDAPSQPGGSGLVRATIPHRR